MVIIFLSLLCLILYYLKSNAFRKTPQWGNFLDGLTNSVNENSTISKILLRLNIGDFEKAKKKYLLKDLSLPPMIKSEGKQLGRIQHDNFIYLPQLLCNIELRNYITSIQLQRTSKIKTNKYANNIIIHIRLNVQLHKNPLYLLSTSKWYLNALKKVQEVIGEKEVVIISDSKDKTLLSIYENKLQCRSITDNTEEEDIHAMMNCAGLISTISSFSFYAGLCATNVWCTTTLQEPQKLLRLRPGIIYCKPDFISLQKKNYRDFI